MDTPEYSLPLSDAATLKAARRWLLLGVVALGVAGLFAGMLGMTKSAFFYTALVVHVDLSVLVWFLTMACMFFTLSAAGRGLPMVDDAAFFCFAGGAVLLALSALSGGEPYMSNYIPVIHHPIFFLGLGLLLCGVLGVLGNLFLSCFSLPLDGGGAGWGSSPLLNPPPQGGRKSNGERLGIHSAAIIMLVSLICFVWSQRTLPADMTGQRYYDYAFWGGGHVLQFVHTQLMLVSWFWLVSAAGIKVRLNNKLIGTLYLLGLAGALAGPVIYLAYDVASDEHRNAFTMLMKHTNGLPALLAAIVIIYSIVIPAKAGIVANVNKITACAGMTLPKICLLMSILLFAAGGFLGYLIAGSNVTVPAHYHGSIVGVTLAFMGVAYLLLPSFGFADVSKSKLAFAQPLIYGGGQLCWMAGMAILGSHGVPRKTPGSADTLGALASFLKHGGDGLAMIGGLLFVFVVLRAVYKGETSVDTAEK